jgi:hypothetical protein
MKFETLVQVPGQQTSTRCAVVAEEEEDTGFSKMRIGQCRETPETETGRGRPR